MIARVRRFARRATGALTGLLMLAGSSACSTFDWQRSLYDIRDQQACQRHNTARHGETGAALECADSSHPDRTDYAEYQQGRDAILDHATANSAP